MTTTGMTGSDPARRRTWKGAIAIAVAGALLVGGCGNDDDDEKATATTDDVSEDTVAEVTVADYCAAVGEVGDGLPDEEQMDRILEVAPEEIAENLEVVIGAIRENGEAAFGDPAVAESFPPIEAFEAENCETDGGSETASPLDEFADYCAVVADIGDDFPDEEQMDRILEVAPEEIAENLEVVIGAIRENGEAAADDPVVAENFGPIEAFEAENCGAGESAAEVDPDATRVEVTATEYAFDIADPQPGRVSFVMTNEGDEVHELQLARLVGDATLEEALAAEDAEAEGLVELVGFAGPASPGRTVVINVEDLSPGNYVAVCFIPLGNGRVHADEGMATSFTVG